MITKEIRLSSTRQYRILAGMKQRCFNPNNQHFRNYGGKGITVCDEWLGKQGALNFYNWSLSHGYSDDLSIDRIDSADNYSPENCVWITPGENSYKPDPAFKLFMIKNLCPTYEPEYFQHQLSKLSPEERKHYDSLAPVKRKTP